MKKALIFLLLVFVFAFNVTVYSIEGVDWICSTTNALFSERHSSGIVSFNGKIWLAGGAEAVYPHKSDVYYTLDGRNWTLANASAEFGQRSAFPLVVFNNISGGPNPGTEKMWLIAGERNGLALNDVYYSENGINWYAAATSTAMPSRHAHSVLVYKNKLWVIAGMGSGGSPVYNDVWWSVNGVDWYAATENAAFGKRSAFAAAVFDDGTGEKMYVIGGYTGTADTNDTWSSEDGITWSRVSSNAGFAPRRALGSLVYRDRLYIAGGFDSTKLYGDVWYTLNGSLWTKLTDDGGFGAREVSTGFLAHDSKLWIIAGGGYGPYKNDVWYSNVSTPTYIMTNTYTPTATATYTPTATITNYHVRINCGGGDYTDTDGKLWVADRGYDPVNGNTFGWEPAARIQWVDGYAGTYNGTSDKELYKTHSYGSDMGYYFDVPEGYYTVTMKFVEVGAEQPGQRVFDIMAEGNVIVDDLDVFSRSLSTYGEGRYGAVDVTVNNIYVSDGQLTLETSASANVGFFCAIEVIKQPGIIPTPTATVTPTTTYTMTNTYTPTFTATYTPTPTDTLYLFTHTVTFTPTFTFFNTNTPLPVFTNTPVPAPTIEEGNSEPVPNIGRDQIKIVFNVNKKTDCRVYIYDFTGKLVDDYSITAGQTTNDKLYKLKIDTSRYPSGVYYYVIEGIDEDGKKVEFKSQKFMIKK